jgi:hypothetical protein
MAWLPFVMMLERGVRTAKSNSWRGEHAPDRQLQFPRGDPSPVGRLFQAALVCAADCCKMMPGGGLANEVAMGKDEVRGWSVRWPNRFRPLLSKRRPSFSCPVTTKAPQATASKEQGQRGKRKEEVRERNGQQCYRMPYHTQATLRSGGLGVVSPGVVL